MSKDELLSRAHRIELDTLDKMMQVCDEYQISYYVDSGTLLGAVRHKGFIPWDDDIDVVFKREDYERLLSLPGEVWGESFKLVKPNELSRDPRYFDNIVRLINMKETIPTHTFDKMGEFLDPNLKNRLGIDCFVLDGAGNYGVTRAWKRFRLLMCYGLLMAHRGKLDLSEYHGPVKVVIAILAHIGKMFAFSTLMNRYNAISQKGNGCKYLMYTNYSGKYLGYVADALWFESSINALFSGRNVPIPIGYHDLLCVVYGDYMKLPPIEARKSEHIDYSEEY